MVAAPVNQPPEAGDPVVGQPNPITGVVTGHFIATDPDGDTISYDFDYSAIPANGQLSLDPSTGSFIFRPNLDVLQNAAPQTTTTITVIVSDGHGNSTPLTVTVPIGPLAPSEYKVVDSIPLNSSLGPWALSHDGRTAYVTTTAYVAGQWQRSVSVIDIATKAVTATIPTGGPLYSPAVTPDGGHVYLVDSYGDSVTVIDTATKATTTVPSSGVRPVALAVSPDCTTCT